MTELTRENFIRTTGIFISHDYFNKIQHDFEGSQQSASEFIKKWIKGNASFVLTTDGTEKIKYLPDDDIISGLSSHCDEEKDERTALDIINDLSEECNHLKSKYQETSLEFYKICKKLEKSMESTLKVSQQLRVSNRLMMDISNQFLLAEAPASTILQ